MAIKSLRDTEPFSVLASTIRDVADGRQIIFVPNKGNLGDAMILYGTIRFLKNSGISYKRVDRRSMHSLIAQMRQNNLRFDEKLLIYGGGGAWCDHYKDAYDTINDWTDFFYRVIVLPSTFAISPKPNKHHIFFRRDNEISRTMASNSLFCHDMGFYFRKKEDNLNPEISIGCFFREDREKHRKSVIPRDNIDISAMGDELGNPHIFFRLLSKYETIKTDRLHVAIAGALLGRQVFLFPSSYAKVAAVYNASIAPYYPNVKLCSWNDAEE